MSIFYRVEVTDQSGVQLDWMDYASLESAKRGIAAFRLEYPDAQWITTNRRKAGRITSMHTLTVHNGTTAHERRHLVSA